MSWCRRVEKIAGVKLKREYDLTAPRGVAGRNSDNTFIKKMLHWEPNTPLDIGLRATYKWIKHRTWPGRPVRGSWIRRL